MRHPTTEAESYICEKPRLNMYQTKESKFFFLTIHLLHTYLYSYSFAAKQRETTPSAKAKAPRGIESVLNNF